MSLLAGSERLPILLYWIQERERVRVKKEAGEPKPWSDDPVFQRTYFCNVHREDDRVTRWIRKEYSPRVRHPLFTHNIILSRFLNWPPTLEEIGYIEFWDPQYVKDVLKNRSHGGKVWGNAYVVTTHGIKMDKIDYLCDRVMPSIYASLEPGITWGTCGAAARRLMSVEGISTFMAGQVVADLKNTPNHSLQGAMDWWSFALPGPGSIRGMEWLAGGSVPRSQWHPTLLELVGVIGKQLNIDLCAQDTQNCLCEFDKYMRVKSNVGRSKRNYDGI